ncbi:hypothetical protein CKM354_000223900 [Cercospora kikuchii]|uniref:Carrier domain-containing protein n=1 Tax=Cercospora kikuchii TaxID=84275 RepID=A0A9P3F9F7_9PEZI|nr:uncharacterized protein CKM354_000223900 [Cercospora kikuchii]GIZ38838.1 hypothetical protein CKM354_000223900 [Cercospora kikuchii]
MESITAFPPQPNIESTPSWKVLKQDIELSRLRAPEIGTLVCRAFAVVIWAYTGDKTVSFVTARCSQAGLDDVAVHEYEHSGTDSDDGDLVAVGMTALGRVPSSRSIIIQCRNELAAYTEQLYLPPEIALQLSFRVLSENRGVQFEARFNQSSLDISHVESYLELLVGSVKALQTAAMPEVLQVASKLSDRDKKFIEQWNGEPQSLISEFIHDRISRVLARNSERSAVESWDGRLSRASLELESSSIATLLLSAGVQPQRIVGILMHKSKSVPTCMLGVLKSGSALILMDPALPHKRLETMIKKLSIEHVLTTRSHVHLIHDLVPSVFVETSQGNFAAACLDEEQRISSTRSTTKLPHVSPSSVAFYIFTSGSSGIPKAVEISHAAFVTSCEENNQCGIYENTRTLQYASYNFLSSITETLGTFMAGGTLCIPGPEERMDDLSGAIQRLQPSLICLTSSVASVLDPNEVSSIKELMLLGEPIQRTTAATWLASETTILRHGYGQSEAGGQCCDIALIQSSRSYRVIGNHSHLNFWIVVPSDHNRLMPVGAVGELLLEGHSLATGYYKEPALTSAVFISAPSWASTLDAGSDGRRWYKTGDLVQYQENGDIVLYGRKDFQLKVNGQRVESTDIEHFVNAVCPDKVEQVVVDKLGPEHNQKLTAIVKLRAAFADAPMAPSAFHKIMHQRLKDVVPTYMIPSEVVFTEEMPKTATGKLHRRALRQQCNDSGEERVSTPEAARMAIAEAGYPELSLLRSLCSRVLDLSDRPFTAGSDWISLGGDSLSAIRFIKHARDLGLRLSTADLMMGRKLSELCCDRQPSNVPSTSVGQCSLGAAQHFPLTDFQRRYVPPVNGSTPGLLCKYELSFRGRIDSERLQETVCRWIESIDTLRLSFSPNSGHLVQSFLDPSSNVWRCRVAIASNREIVATLSAQHDFLKHPVLAILCDATEPDQADSCLVLHISHSIMDATSSNYLFQDLVGIYAGRPAEVRPSFAQYLEARLSEQPHVSFEHWRALLAGSKPLSLRSALRPLCDLSEQDLAIRTATRVAILPTGDGLKATMSTVVHTAWSLVLSVLTKSSDVMFLYLTHGRDDSLEGSDTVIGCCVNEVPCRVILDETMSSSKVLNNVQEQIIQSMAHAHLGANTIANKCTDWPQKEIMYDHSSLVVHQNVPIEHSWAMGNDGYMNLQEVDFEEQWNYDFDLSTSSSSANELYVELKCLHRLYTGDELAAVMKGFLIAVRMLKGGIRTVADIRAKVGAVEHLPIVVSAESGSVRMEQSRL